METLFGRTLPGTADVGESWELFDRPSGSNRIANGPLRGRTLAELRGGKELPLLVKILDCRRPLSVQVHPTAEAALATGTEEKTEAWFILDVDPGARIWRGFRDGVMPEHLHAALLRGTPDDVLQSFEPRVGDTVLIPAGMVHAMGAGIVALEVQQSSETTWRLYDWGRTDEAGRPRQLHLEEALRWALYAAPGAPTVESTPISDDGLLKRDLCLQTRHFSVERWCTAATVTAEGGSEDGLRWRALFCVSGRGTIAAFDRTAPEAPIVPGTTVLLPADLDPFEIAATPGSVLDLLLITPAG
jgi:mannose-6-phosphate isomerase